ncbi:MULTISPECIES: Crp/Fnr family transcriptional regulator [Leeuwenhoekiella]|uniref:CRP-like cAMP-binding protein n=1 Tax=Leeuwenhoekiella palythoae TaxID=573501 RepID=A0A1M5WNC2_9FLAO|nr:MULTISPECIES: Crp/Fnr family transcriptional regulator [Leeuwenhoekiella]MBH13228.1 Crp/Fnr family transcriptional regulator [Leeuwenhoekiella sp.]RXG31446.1 CRP-like cAMP-binding protein [Leeuwenhoekiella palythoae]UBZ08930.1 Crp/Fnr family transcriptional regulator [Leeuwenhoekiella palythoae]SHH88999.1 cAMP-binding domain of CRP or a regulatory subunit of cAMP-dependent protein kinases [Leeuwenhoekiella palythoae]|tara:strand:- start:6175 stop:6876 length:702 start_codon:yes stop_codon:yes gene_type:complete
MAAHEESRCENCIIRQLNSLKALKKEELKAISDSKETRTIKKGEPLFKEGEKLNGVFCVRNGVSKLSKISDNGKDQIVKIASKGEVMGQRSVIAEEATNLSAVALNDMEVCFIPKTNITARIEDNPAFTQAILKYMAQELKLADDVIVNMAQKTVNQRLAEVLLYLDKTFGQDDEGYLALILSRSDIADVVGTATELCIRTLAKFKKEQLLETKGKRIKLLDKKGLTQIKEGF